MTGIGQQLRIWNQQREKDMKKWFVLALIACVAGVVQAGEEAGKKGKGKGKDVTKEQFIEKQKKNAEKKGLEFDQAKAEAQFAKKDKNNDGVLSGDEKSKGKGKDKDKGHDRDKDKYKDKDKDHDQDKGHDRDKDKDHDQDEDKGKKKGKDKDQAGAE